MSEPITVTHRLTVPFYDVDPMQVVWHGHYVKYFEQARCALLERIDYGYQAMHDSGYTWPVVDLKVRYIAPARCRQVLDVRVTLGEIDYGLQMDFEITDAQTGQRLARGQTRQVAVDRTSGEMCLVSPPVLQQRIEAARS